MLDTSGKGMYEEFEASRRQQEGRLYSWDEMIGRFHGPHWDRNAKHGGNEPENPAFEWIATMKAQMIAGDPQCAIDATRTDRPETRLNAIALKHALNRLSRDGDDKRFWRKQFVDWCFCLSAFVIQRVPTPWADRGPLDGPVHRPQMRRISPPRLRMDARATEWNDTRWRGYELIASKSAVFKRAQQEQGWDMAAIAAIDSEYGLERMLPREGQNLKRDDFNMKIAWVPEEQLDEELGPEDGFWGTMHFYAQTKSREALTEIRRPQPYYGPRSGPIYMSGQETVPDSPHPLAIMVAIENLSKSLRLQSQVIDQAMRDYKRFVLEGTGQANLAAIIKNIRHGGIAKAKGFRKDQAVMLTTGGVDADMHAMYSFLLDRMDRRSGLNGTARGQPTEGATATAEAIAQGGSVARIESLRDEFYCHVRDAYRARAELIDMDDQFFMPLPPEAQKEMGVPAVSIQGGREKGQSFEDYELKMNVLSMPHRTVEEREMAAARELELWTVVGERLPQTPFLDWDGILTDIGEAWDKPELRERVNYPMAEQVAGLLLMGAISEGMYQPGGSKAQPVSARDSGAGRTMDTTGSSKPAGGAQKKLGAGAGAGTARPAPKPASLPGNRAGAGAASKVTRAGRAGARR